jgi:electron transfer flavoprotein beta subunit
MKIVVPVQLVPDMVEELSIDAGGKALDMMYMRLMLNEFDDHAIEQAILLKEKYGGTVTVIAPDVEGADDALFTAAAKGADRLVKVSAEFNDGWNTHALTRLFAPIIEAAGADLVLTGVQSHNSLDGTLGPQLAEILGLPFVGYISGIKAVGGKASVRKEYPGGLIAEIEVKLPAVLGIQAAETAPRYVPISKVRQAMKTSKVSEESGELNLEGSAEVGRMFQPETTEKATMIEGDVDEVAARLVEILKEQGIL